ncbi:hypothetical protein [Salinispora arenicola]|uniref:hypothetical protein n=1 Tax=Salinispora arenicola TaxID=168697 RepID=UPI00037796D4|nr:hypothetical protein [Salinispora arenicola]
MAAGLNGVGIRACELAAAFSSVEEVTVLAPDIPHPEISAIWPGLRFQRGDAGSAQAVPGRDILLYGFATEPAAIRQFKRAGGTVGFDAIVWPLEYLTYQSVRAADDPDRAYARHLDAYLNRLRLAHRFLVASETEKKVLAGMLSIADHERVRSTDQSLDDLVAILPIGFSQTNENTANPASTSGKPAIGDAPVFVWNGGLWNHYTPIPAIDALAELDREGVDVRLWFLYPQRGTPTAAYRAAVAASESRPALSGKVRFINGGLSMAERVDVLRHATASVCLYPPHALWDLCPPMRLRETLVYHLPIIAAERGALGGIIAAEGCGATVRTLDAEAVAAAMWDCLDTSGREGMRAAAAGMAAAYSYEKHVPEIHMWLQGGSSP